MFPNQPYGSGLYLDAVKNFIWSLEVLFVPVIRSALKYPVEYIPSTSAGFQPNSIGKEGEKRKFLDNGYKK